MILVELCKTCPFSLLGIERIDFSEVTGGLRLVEPPARRKGCCLFTTYQWGKPWALIYRGNEEGAKLPHGPITEKTNPRALEVKKCRPSLGKYEFCKALIG
jgi:hypothetical protein